MSNPRQRSLFTMGRLGQAYVACRKEGVAYGKCMAIASNLVVEKGCCDKEFQVLKQCATLQVMSDYSIFYRSHLIGMFYVFVLNIHQLAQENAEEKIETSLHRKQHCIVRILPCDCCQYSTFKIANE